MAHTSIRFITATAILLNATTAFSQELNFQMLSAKGVGDGVSCNPNNVQMVSAGTNMSLTYSEMNADLPGDGPNTHLSESGTCTVALALTIPKGIYLQQASSQVFGGVEKSQGGTAAITSTMYLTHEPYSTRPALRSFGDYGQILFSQKIFSPWDVVSEPLLTLSDSKDFSDKEQKKMCRWTKSKSVTIGMLVQLMVTGTRKTVHDTTIVNVDGTDANFNIGMSTGRCI